MWSKCEWVKTIPIHSRLFVFRKFKKEKESPKTKEINEKENHVNEEMNVNEEEFEEEQFIEEKIIEEPERDL